MRRLFALSLALSACRSTPGDRHEEPTPAPTPSAAMPDTDTATDFDPSVWNERCVIAQGYAQGQKIGAMINLGGPTLGVIFPGPDGDSQWTVPLGARVRVEGRVVQRADLPVFVQDPNEPIMQGISVPPGTDLEQARRRWVIEQTHTTVLRTPAQAEAELETRVGQTTTLLGIVWSRNGVWWLSHDGADVHLEGAEAEALGHGEAVSLHGVLVRKKMPRLDQLVVRAEPELAEAFVLQVESIEVHPIWPLEACPDHRPSP